MSHKRFGQGVILGDEDTPMRNVVFDSVRVVNTQVGDKSLKPFNGNESIYCRTRRWRATSSARGWRARWLWGTPTRFPNASRTGRIVGDSSKLYIKPVFAFRISEMPLRNARFGAVVSHYTREMHVLIPKTATEGGARARTERLRTFTSTSSTKQTFCARDHP